MSSVLLFNIHDPEKVNLLHVLSIRLNFSCLIIPPECQECLIQDLLARRFKRSSTFRPFHDEMLVINELSHPDLNFLLNELIRTGHPIRLKAVVTPTNEKWTAAMLHTQLLAEDRTMNQNR